MSDPAFDLQVALVTKLKTVPTAAGARVYDTVPKDAAYPYVVVGPAQVVPTDEDGFDASENYVQIDIWSRAVGFPEAKQIAGALRVSLHDQPLSISGQVCDWMTIRNIIYSRDPDGLTSRARIDLLVDTQPQ